MVSQTKHYLPLKCQMQIISEKARLAIRSGQNIRLNLGAGEFRCSELLNVDIRKLESTDIVADLNKGLCLIPDNSVVEIYSRHAFEHIQKLDLLLKEISRVCVPGAKLKIIVPHFSNPFGYSDPTHVRFFGIYSFCYYSENKFFRRRISFPRYNKIVSFTIHKVNIRFYRYGWFDRIFNPIIEYLINSRLSFLEFYEYRLSYFIPAREIEFNLVISK